MKTGALPADSAWLFPEYDWEALERERHSGVIIERILERGSWQQVRWLFETYGEEHVAEWVRQHGFRLLSKRSFALWRLALGIKDYAAPDWAREARSTEPQPPLESTVDYHGVQLASPTDIGLMKLAAINSRGTRRDFLDVYCLREIVSLDKLLGLAAIKYANRPSFLAVAVRALAYFEDAEQQPMPRLLVPARWRDVRAYCEAAARNLARRMSGLDSG